MPESRRNGFLTGAVYTAERAGRADVAAALLASLPDETARQAMTQTVQ